MSTAHDDTPSPNTGSEAAGNVAVAAPQATAPTAKRRRPAALTNIPSRYAILVVWAALIGLYIGIEPHSFAHVPTFQAIFNSQEPLVFMTMALLCTIVIGEFVDLSVPSVFGFAATVMPVLVGNHGWNVWLGALAGIVAATVVGVINAWLVVKLHVNTIVVTLGMSTLLTGLSLLISGDNVSAGIPASFAKIANTDFGGLPASFYYGVVLVLGFAYLLAATPLGRHMRFVGASREVSRLSGVRVDRIRFGSFVFAGLLAGIGAVIEVASIGSYNASGANEYLLSTFAAVFLGTAVIEPGRFSPLGTFIGIYFLETGVIGLQLKSAAVWIEPTFYGAVLVVAVTISTLLHRRTT
jgi:ribose transport system permease protein